MSSSVIATEGVLLSCDAAMRQYILHLDETTSEEAGGRFVINMLDDETHLFVKEVAVEYIQRKVDELQASNTFSRAADYEAKRVGGEEKDAGGKKRRQT